jgi:hypothetical protein
MKVNSCNEKKRYHPCREEFVFGSINSTRVGFDWWQIVV